MTTPEPAKTEERELQPSKYSSHQYRWLINNGILTTEYKVELIEGEIRPMEKMGPARRRVMRKLNTWLALEAGENYVLECQLTVELAEGFTPDPDFILARWKEDGYPEGENPGKTDVLLAIEVADSSLAYKLGQKALAYARAGVPELWVVDIPHRQVHVLIQPSKDGYRTRDTADESHSVTALLIPGLQLPVAEAL